MLWINKLKIKIRHPHLHLNPTCTNEWTSNISKDSNVLKIYGENSNNKKNRNSWKLPKGALTVASLKVFPSIFFLCFRAQLFDTQPIEAEPLQRRDRHRLPTKLEAFRHMETKQKREEKSKELIKNSLKNIEKSLGIQRGAHSWDWKWELFEPRRMR